VIIPHFQESMSVEHCTVLTAYFSLWNKR